MNIIQEKKNELEAVIRIKISEEDYKENVEKGLKEAQKSAKIAGFRPGKAPMGMIKKMYEKSVRADEINKLLVDSVYDFIKENNLNIIGSPIPVLEDVAKIDWENQKEFEMSYDIGFAPEVNILIDDKIKVDYYNVKATDKIIEEQVTELRKRYGKIMNPEVATSEDVLFGEFVEMETEDAEKENAHKHKSNLFVQYLKDEDIKTKFVGFKQGDSLVFDPLAATGNETETAHMLGVKKEQLAKLNSKFKFTVESVSRVEPADMNEEFFNKIAAGKDIKDETAFKSFIASQIEQQFQLDSDKHFKNDAIKKIIEKAKLTIPENFMKKWLIANNKNEVSKEQIEKEFESYADSFRWQFIENHIIKENNVEVKEEEIKNHLSDYFRAQMRQYGQDNLDDAVIDDFVKNILKKEDEARKVFERLMDDKILDLFKTKLKLNKIDISFDDFLKLVSEKYKNEQPIK
ncbi:MAG: trigger factor [Bacteroidetes bacterium]|nr:trigger factor [Bacteroidota bacterium]